MKGFRDSRSILLILAAVLILTGEELGIPWIPQVVLVAVGIIAIIGAIRIINQGEAYEGIFGMSNLRYIQRYPGLMAWLVGLLLGLGGLLVLALSLVDLFSPGGASTFLGDLIDSSFGQAILLGIAGLMVTTYGMIRLLSGRTTTTGSQNLLEEFSNKSNGVILTMIGLILLGFSFGLLLSPGFLKALYEQALRLVNKLMK